MDLSGLFEDTQLIIKSDYMSRRKCLLLHLLSKGFLIQGNRKLAFTPEDAAEFYKDLADDKCYMLYVILLSKGTSEAFILRKENAVEELLNTMICFFGTSVEMDRNIHVSRSNDAARREITFVFPNYIHEPLPYFEKHRFCTQPLLGPFIGQAYEIAQAPIPDPEMNWRTKLSNWLIETNATLPRISNQCSLRPQIGSLDRHQQTEPVQFKGDKVDAGLRTARSSTSSRDTSGLLSTSSCVSCSSFEREEKEPCPPCDLAEFEARLKCRAEKTLEEPCKKSEDSKVVCDEHIEWVKDYEYEDAGAVEDDLAGMEEGAAEVEDNAGIDFTEHYSVEDKVPETDINECNIEVEEQVDVLIDDAMYEAQVEEPTEPAPPAEGALIEEKPADQTVTEGPAAADAEPLPAGEAEPVQIVEAEPVQIGEAEPVEIAEAEPVQIGEAEPVQIGEAPPETEKMAEEVAVSNEPENKTEEAAAA